MAHVDTGLRKRTQETFLGMVLTPERILSIYLSLVGLISLVFYALPSGKYDRNANLLVSVLAFLLLFTVKNRRLYPVVVHAVTAMAVMLVFYIASLTGGVNAAAMIWLGVVSVPVLLLLGPGATFAWIGINLVALLGLFMATLQGWMSPASGGPTHILFPMLMNYVLAVCNLMLSVAACEHLHVTQIWEVENRNDELRNLHEALIQAQAHKDEFTAAVGHELRTPMNAILGFNGVLRQELADRPEQIEVVDHIRHSTSHLLRVVNDILDFSQLQAGKLMLHPTDVELRPVLQEALAAQKDTAREKALPCRLDIDPGLPSHAHVDRQRLQQVLSNLLDNAFKFTDQGQVVLRVVPAQARWRFEIEDTGRGIAPERQAHIFRRFEHADVQTNRAYGGTGLGLTICERLVAMQGGEIGVRSTPGQGSVFWFELPLPPVRSAHLQATPVEALPSSEPLRILLVDDNSVNLMVARLQLQKIWPQARITQANDGPEALRCLDVEAFDVALIDMVMPGMDGMQLTRHIRQRFPAAAAHMPIVALTANTHPEEGQRCLEAGMDDVLHKPIETDKLVPSVSLLVRRARELDA